MRVLLKSLRDNRRGWVDWPVALAAVAAMYAAFWPTIGKNPSMTAAMEAYPQALKEALHMQDLSRPESYLGSTVFGLLVPILLAVFAISAGVRAIATDEEAGTLDLVMAHPVSRVSLALQRLGAIIVELALIAGLVGLVIIGLRGPAEFPEVSVANIAAISLQLALFGLFFGALAFSVGAWTGRKTLALGAGAGVAVLAYLANSFLPQIEGLEWTEKVSPFHWYLGGEPLRNGLDASGIGLLLGVSVVLIALGTWRFTRRDLAVG
jgi:ABC-2 type transport system permease protein